MFKLITRETCWNSCLDLQYDVTKEGQNILNISWYEFKYNLTEKDKKPTGYVILNFEYDLTEVEDRKTNLLLEVLIWINWRK